MIRLVIFDFSGTLAYYGNGDMAEFFAGLADYGIRISGEAEAEHFLDSLSALFGQVGSWIELAETLANRHNGHFGREETETLAEYLEKNLRFRPYDDVKEIIALPQKKAVMTLASRFLVESIPELKGFDVFTPQEIGYEKPDKRAFTEVLKIMRTAPQEALMVGDTLDKDIRPALALKMKAVLIDRTGKVSDNSIVKISSLKELKQYL